MTNLIQNPTTGETIHETQYKQWLESREEAHKKHLSCELPPSMQESFERIFGGAK